MMWGSSLWAAVDRGINLMTEIFLPPDLIPQMNMAEEARCGKLDVSKVYRPLLKVCVTKRIERFPFCQGFMRTEKEDGSVRKITWRSLEILR